MRLSPIADNNKRDVETLNYYVDSNGYSTVQAAINAAGTSTGTYAAVNVHITGNHSAENVIITSNINLIGTGTDIPTIGNLTIRPVDGTTKPSDMRVVGIRITGTTTVTNNNGSGVYNNGVGSNEILFSDVSLAGAITFTDCNYLSFNQCYFSSTVTCTNTYMFPIGCTFGTINVLTDSTDAHKPSDAGGQFTDIGSDIGTLTLTRTAGVTTPTAILYNSRIGTLTVNANCDVQAYGGSISTYTNSGTATVFKTLAPYTPATSGNWASVPNTSDGALDNLAAKVGGGTTGTTALIKSNNLSDVGTKATAFNNVSPVTSTGDIIVGNGANSNTRLAIGTQYQTLQANATTAAYDAVHLDQSAAVTGILPNANTTAVSTNTASKIVTRDGSGNFAAGTITAALTGTASGNTTYSANNHGVVVSSSSNAMTVVAPNASTAYPLVSGGSSADPAWALLTVAGGGTGSASVVSAPAATAWAGWDANKNLSANNALDAYTTTATAAGTTTLVVGSTYQQYFTGSTTQTVVLPVTSTLVLGQQFLIANNSTGAVTVQSSGNNTITTMIGSSIAVFTCILTSGTGTASWSAAYVPAFTSTNTASNAVVRDGSGNFSAGTVTAALTGTASGNTTYTANQYGVVLSGSGNTMSVLAPVSGTTKVLTSGGTGANPTWASVTAGQVAQSEVAVNTANGYGSTNTKIARFTTTFANNGTDITYADSAGNGASFTINTAGIYSITWTAYIGSATQAIGITKNTTQATTNIRSVNDGSLICGGFYGSVDTSATAAVITWLAVNDVIRPHADGQTLNASVWGDFFRITRLA